MLFKFKLCTKLNISPDICLLDESPPLENEAKYFPRYLFARRVSSFRELVSVLGAPVLGDLVFLFAVCGHSVMKPSTLMAAELVTYFPPSPPPDPSPQPGGLSGIPRAGWGSLCLGIKNKGAQCL